MCYLIAKDFNSIGSCIVRTNYGLPLVDFYNRVEKIVKDKGIQLVVLSNPLAFGEYEPYSVCSSEEEFEARVKEMCYKKI